MSLVDIIEPGPGDQSGWSQGAPNLVIMILDSWSSCYHCHNTDSP